jgi:hypothetical protein
MVRDGLVQTILAPELLEWARSEAANSGISVAAWLRRLVMQHKQSAVVPAWVRPANESKGYLHALGVHSRERPADFMLQRAQIHSDGSTEFRAYLPDGSPYTAHELYARDMRLELLRQRIQDGWFALEGSLSPWMLVDSYADTMVDDQIIFRLKPEPKKVQ